MELNVSAVPLLPDAQACIEQAPSSLQTANELVLREFELGPGLLPGDPRIRLLADPQTSGGLLATVPVTVAQACLAALQNAGYEAAIVGEICSMETMRLHD